MMRTHGEINGVSFQRKGFNIYNLAFEYKIWDYTGNKTVFVNSMLELKEALILFLQENHHGATREN